MVLTADGRGRWIPDGTAGSVVAILILVGVIIMFGYGIWNKRRKKG
ncbi:hypothetical protein [Streptomyces sp. SID14478]|nr:hypothetical protein [Streptomyces sp. SID14478]